MPENKKMTVPVPSAATDGEQPLLTGSNNSITQSDLACNSDFPEMQQEFQQLYDPLSLKTVSMAELFGSIYQRKPPVVDGFLYQGTYLFVGAPKLGKSFLMAQIAYHVSTGTPLWGFPVRQGTVLYLALEDDFGRLQERLYRMFGPTENKNLHLSISARQLSNGLNEQLTGFLRDHPDTSLIIIDTLQKIREVGGDIYSYANDYQIITRLKSLSDGYGVCLMIVHHTRKQKADDTFDMISGTNGLMGAADGAFLLQKEKRTSNTATLEISGRDQQDQRIFLLRNEETLCWDLDHIETELWKTPPEPILDEIAKRITEDCSEWSGSPTELCEFLGVEMKANTLTQKLNVNAGRLLEEYGIRYWNKRCHAGRQVGLRLAQRDDA